MPEEKDNIDDLNKRFFEKNKDFIREVMSAFWIRFDGLEFSQGKMTKGKSEKHYKEVK